MNNFAISSSGIGEALQRSAAALATAGNSIEESIGLIVAANDVVQNPEVVGTAMKTLSMFYRSARTEAENAGIATDGMAESTAKLRQELLALTGGKLDIQINEHEFMSTYDMLKKLSEIWDEIGEASEINQARILEMLGGKRNANVLSSILTNFQDAIAASETAARSSGSAWAENEKYLNSIEGKTKQLQASFETFANQVINSGVVKAFIDIQTAIVNTASWLEKMGLLLPTITALVATIKTIQSISQATKATNVVLGIIGGEGDLATKIKSITDAVSGLGVVAKNLAGKNIATAISGMTIDGDLAESVNTIASGMQNAAFKTITFDGVITALKAKLTGLGQGLKTLATSSIGKFTIGITAAISLLTLAKNAYDSYINSLIDGANQAYQTHTETVKTIESGKKSLEKMDEEFRDLSSRVGKYGSQGKLTNEEYERYLELVNEIITITPSLKNAYNEKGASLKTGYVDILDEAIQKLDEMSQKDAEFTSNKASSNMQGWEAELNQYSKTVKETFDHLLWDMISSLETESGEKVSSLWSDFIIEFGGGDLFNNLAEGFSTINLDVAYNAIDKIEKFKEKLLNSGVDKEDIDAWMQGFGPLSQFYDWYKETTTKIVDTYMTSSKAWEATKGLYETIADADKLNELKAGLYEVLRPGMSGDEAYTATLDYLTKFASALNDIQYALGTGSSYDALRAFEELKVKWAGSPTILKMIENAIADMTGAENANADATDKVTQSYANLEKILSKISGFNSFLNKARNGENDPFGMISSAKDVADAYNELVAVTDDIPKIDWTAMTGTVGEDGKITWDTTLIEGYIDAIIDASIANTEFANSNPQAIQWLKDMAKEYGNASKSVTGFSDALSAVQKVADIGGLLEDFSDSDSDRAELLEQLDGILNIWNEFSKEAYPNRKPYTIADMLGANGDDFDLMNTMLDKFKREVIADFMQDAGLSSDNWLVKWLLDASLTVDKTKDKIFEVSDAINGFKTAISFKQASLDMDKDDTPAKILEEAVDMLEAYNKAVDAKKVSGDKKTLGDFLTIDENGIRRNIDQMEAYVDAMVEIQTSGITDDTARENAKKALKAYYDGLVAETKEATFEISDAMNGFNEAITFKQAALDMSEDDTPVKILEDAVNMLEAYNKAVDAGKISGGRMSLENFLTIDSNGMRRNLDQMEAYVDAMVEIQTADISDPTARENAKKALKDYYDGLVQTTEKATFEMSDAMSGFNEAISFKQAALDMSEDDTPVKILEDAVNMLEAYNKAVKAGKIAGNELKLGDFLTIDADGMRRNVDQVETYVNAMIEIQTAGIEDETARENAKKALKDYYDGLVKTVEEATFEMQDAMSGFSNAMSFKQAALDMSDDDNPAKVLEDAVNMLESYNKAVKAGKIAGEERTLESFLTIDSTGMRRNLDQMESYVDAMIEIQTAGIADPAARENAKKALKDYYNSLVAETKDAFSQISEAYTFMQEHIVGDRVGDISKVYDDLEKLRDLTGNKELQLTDFIKWDDDLQDFVYKTDLLSSKIDELATKIATEMVDAEIAAGNAMDDALRSDEIAKRANAIKSSLGGVVDVWNQLSSAAGNVKSLQGLKSDYNSYLTGDMSFLDMLSNTISLAETLGITMEDAFDIDSDGKLIVNIENMENGLVGVIDKLEASGTITARLAEQLRLAARAASEVETNAQRIQNAYERAKDAVSAGSGRSRGQQLTYDDYKAMIERDARYADAVQYVNGVMSVNVDLYNQTTEAIAKETAEMALLEAAQRKLKIDEYQKELKTNTKLTNEQRASMQKEIEKLKLEAKGYAVLANEIANATNQFERFRNAAGNSEADTYMDAKSALKMINDVLFNVESELFGELGNEQFHEAIKLLIDPDVDFSDPNWINKVKEKLGESKKTLEDWFGEGTSDNPQTTRSNMNSFWDYLVGGDFATEEIDEAGQHWGKFKENVDVESMAQHFGVTKDAMRAALQQLEKFSALSFDWKVIDPEYYAEVMAKAEELKKASEEAQQKAAEAQKEAEQAKKDADEATAAYEAAKESGDEAAEAKAKDAADEAAKKAEEAQKAAEDAKAAAEEAAKNVAEQESSSTDELKKSLEEILADIEKITSEPIELDMTSAIESSQTVIDNFTMMLELIGELNAINETLMGVNDNVAVVQESVNMLGESEVDIDTTAAVNSIFDIVDAASDAQQAVYNVDGLPIDINESPAISSIQSVINALSALSSSIDAVNRKSISPKSSSPTGGSTGGVSSAGGTVSAKGGRTLVGELGREVVVDVDSGRWYTVGNKGPEFVDLPKRAIVFNNSKTEELLGKTTLKLNGYSMAAGTKANSGVGGGMINLDALRTPTEKETQKTVQHISDEVEEAVDVLEQLAEAYKLANETLEHLIEHEEFSYFQAERASNYDRMHTVLANEIEIYKAIMKNSQEGIEKLKAEGADDGNEYLQELEESYWDAYRSMYEALDNIRSLYSDALNDEVDNIQSAFKNLTNAVKEYNTSGLISIDTFQAILDNGIEYLGLLKDENGSFDVNANAAQALLQYRKDQLAIETAIAYVNRLQEALANGEVQKVNELVAAKGQIGRSTWDIVYANLALLKSQGLNNEQYQLALDNINKLRDLAKVTMDDFGTDDKIAEVKSKFEELNKEIEHYIAHQEFAFQVGERGMNFTAMNQALENEVGYYKRIMEEAQKTISELAALGAKDTDEALQSVEESYWSAYNKMYSTLDQLRKLRMDALSDRLDGLKNSFSSLKKAAEEYSMAGGISLDTLDSLLSNGFQYMSLLDEQNGQLVISKDRVNQYINARKNQLAIESALNYIAQVREAVENKEDDRLQNLITTMDAVSNSTWGYVYAQAALLKTSMNDAQYKAFIDNLDKMKVLADSVVYDYAESQGDITDEYGKQSDALDQILKFTEDLIRAENKKQIDALNDQIDAYKKIIDLKKESLDTTKQENEYQDNVAEKVKELAELQAKADLLALDTSRSASVERQKLLQDIADKQKDLAKYQQDYSLDAQKEALDKDYEAYEENKNLEIENLEEIVSSEEKVYQLAIARIRDQWSTLYQDLIEWNTEEGSVINQEITDAWNEATKAVGRYGSAVAALEAFKNASDNVVVADIPMYHSGGIVGDKGSLNEDEVLAILEKGELVVTKPMKQALYTAVDFVHELGEKLGVKLEQIRNFAFGDMRGAFTPAFATPENVPVTQTNNITFSPSFNVEFNGVDIRERDAKSLGRDVANVAANNLFEAFSKRGIDSLRTLRQ